MLAPLVLILVLVSVTPAAAAERQLVDEVVAVVEAQSITLTELEAETRIHLAAEQSPSLAMIRLDKPILAASLRRLIKERVVLAEVERLKLFDLEGGEREALLKSLRQRFPSLQAWEEFLRKLEMTEEEVGAVLARGLRVSRYLDNRLKLSAQLRDSELDDRLRELGEKAPHTAAGREALRRQLAAEKYDKQLTDLLSDLSKRASVRVLDSLDAADPLAPSPGQAPQAPAGER